MGNLSIILNLIFIYFGGCTIYTNKNKTMVDNKKENERLKDPLHLKIYEKIKVPVHSLESQSHERREDNGRVSQRMMKDLNWKVCTESRLL